MNIFIVWGIIVLFHLLRDSLLDICEQENTRGCITNILKLGLLSTIENLDGNSKAASSGVSALYLLA